MPEREPAEFFKPRRGKWSAKKYAARKALSAIVGRDIRMVRAPAGSAHWKQGLLRVEDAKTGELLAIVDPQGFRDPETGWDLRADC